ncbi:unnamed protein product [Discosporangium mesarthrocarpum]
MPLVGRVEYNYNIHTGDIKEGGVAHSVRHLWYYRWRDFETPGSADREGVLSLAREAAIALQRGERVMVVCYSGRGRSGTLVAAAWGLAKGITTNKDLVETVVAMREKRDSMLETPSQLLFVRQLLQLPDTLTHREDGAEVMPSMPASGGRPLGSTEENVAASSAAASSRSKGLLVEGSFFSLPLTYSLFQQEPCVKSVQHGLLSFLAGLTAAVGVLAVWRTWRQSALFCTQDGGRKCGKKGNKKKS